MNSSQPIALALAQGMQEREREISLLSHLPMLTQGSGYDPQLQAHLEQIRQSYPFYSWIGVTDTQGVVQVATGNLLQGQDVSQRPWFGAGRQGPYVGDAHDAVLLDKLLAAPAAAPAQAPAEQHDDRRFMVLPLSARTPAALLQSAEDYRSWLAAHPEATLSDVCITAGAGRAHFEHRAALVVNSLDSARELLGALADDRPAPGLVRGTSADKPKTAWLFPGQGSQFAGMAKELFETEPVFAETVRQCAAAVADVLEKPLLDVIFEGPEDTLRLTSYAQPAIFAVEMGLARLWQSWGIEPDAVLGHSGGLCGRRVQPGGRRPADRRARPPVRQPAGRWPHGGGVRRSRVRRARR